MFFPQLRQTTMLIKDVGKMYFVIIVRPYLVLSTK